MAEQSANDENNGNNTADSYVLDLESLSAEYDALLIQYDQAVTNYVSFLQQQTGQTTTQFTQMKGKEFWGSGSISSNNNVTTVNACQTLCSSNTNCTGATYNTDKQLCFLRSGEGETKPSSSKLIIAIIPEEKQLLLILNSINQKLTSINSKILATIENAQPLYNTQYAERITTTKELQQNFLNLTKQREKISKKLQDYEDLEKEEITGSLMVNSNYYSFILLLFLAIIIIFLLFKFTYGSNEVPNVVQSGGRMNNIGYYIIFFIVILTITIKYYYKI